jgi:hypothetical protein
MRFVSGQIKANHSLIGVMKVQSYSLDRTCFDSCPGPKIEGSRKPVRKRQENNYVMINKVADEAQRVPVLQAVI